jgi:hypothetical protein
MTIAINAMNHLQRFLESVAKMNDTNRAVFLANILDARMEVIEDVKVDYTTAGVYNALREFLPDGIKKNFPEKSGSDIYDEWADRCEEESKG